MVMITIVAVVLVVAVAVAVVCNCHAIEYVANCRIAAASHGSSVVAIEHYGILEPFLNGVHHFAITKTEQHGHAQALERGANGRYNLVIDLPFAFGLRPKRSEHIMEPQ